jgi:flagellar hook-associated protein 3 FlgL
MTISCVSTLATQLMTQDSLRSTQNKLNEAQNELSTGRFNDVGLALGGNVSRNLNWRISLSDTTHFIDMNNQALAKADALQSSLEAARTTASNFLNTLAGARNAINGQSLAKQGAGYAIDAVAGAVNVSYAGQYLMAGQNSAQAPLLPYTGGAAQSAFDTAFQSHFGISKTDPLAQNITSSQMTSFLQGAYENLFQTAAWSGSFSNASVTNLQTRIDTNQTVDLSANANETPIKDLMRGMVAALDAGTGQLNAATFQTVIDYSISKISNAVAGLGGTQARVGGAQQVVTQTNTKLSSMKLVIQSEIQKTENVDSAEAATRITNLMNQMEASYAVTGKLSKLSLLSFI